MHHACTVASIQAELPTAKQWGWQWFPVRNAAQKKTEQGGDQPSFTDLLARIPQKFVELFEQGKLVRTIFLIWYSTLNLILYTEAYYRHKESPVGLALRGQAFFMCTDTDGLGRPCEEGPTSTQVGPLTKLQDVGAGIAYPYAKGFGQLLNLNCALMLLPVFRKVQPRGSNPCGARLALLGSGVACLNIREPLSRYRALILPALHQGVRYLHDISSLKGSRFSFIQYVLPLDKNIVGHKMIAKYFIFFRHLCMVRCIVYEPGKRTYGAAYEWPVHSLCVAYA